MYIPTDVRSPPFGMKHHRRCHILGVGWRSENTFCSFIASEISPLSLSFPAYHSKIDACPCLWVKLWGVKRECPHTLSTILIRSALCTHPNSEGVTVKSLCAP